MLHLLIVKVQLIIQSSTCVIANSTVAGRFAISDTKFYNAIVTLSTQDNTKLLQQLKFGFKRTINWNKYQSDPKAYPQNRYLSHLVDLKFQGVNRLFVLSFENKDDKRSHSEYYLPKLEIKDYNIMINGNKIFDQTVNNDFKTYGNIRKVATGHGDDYITGCFLDYPYFK